MMTVGFLVATGVRLEATVSGCKQSLSYTKLNKMAIHSAEILNLSRKLSNSRSRLGCSLDNVDQVNALSNRVGFPWACSSRCIGNSNE